MVSDPIYARWTTSLPQYGYLHTDRMDEAGEVLGGTVLACLAEDLSPAEAYERLASVESALGIRPLHTCLSGRCGLTYTDVLVRLALGSRPPPPRLFSYIETMCVYRSPSMSFEEYDERGIVVSLLTQLLASKPADHVAVDAIAHLILEAGGHAQVLEHLPTKLLIDAFGPSTCDFWRATLRLVRDPNAAGAQLFMRLVHGAVRDGWPPLHEEDTLEVLLREIQDVVAQVDAAGTSSEAMRHALAALQHGVTASADDLFDDDGPATSTPKLCGSSSFSSYTTALVQAWRKSDGRARRVPLQAPHPEPDMVLLVHTLARLDVNWSHKKYTALGLFQMRAAQTPANGEAGRGTTLVFLHELIVATTLCALHELGADTRARTAQAWRHVLGGVVRMWN